MADANPKVTQKRAAKPAATTTANPAPAPVRKVDPAAGGAKYTVAKPRPNMVKGKNFRPTTAATRIQPLNPYDVILHPVVTEKTMFNMDNNNTLEFLVKIDASKPEIQRAVQELFTVKVQKVTTRITKDGKRAVVRFPEDVSAEDIGTRIGVF